MKNNNLFNIFNCYSGPATVQYEPDVCLILNRDTLDDANGERWVRVAIEKNRHGPSEVEYRHRLYGAFYHLSPHGQPVTNDDSFQSERIPLKNNTPLTRT